MYAYLHNSNSRTTHCSMLSPLNPQTFLSRSYQNVVFAGGGNRCWWQAGLVEQLASHACWQATRLVGASAGAAMATAFAAQRLPDALHACLDRFRRTPRNVEWKRLLTGRRPFVLPEIYREWTDSFLDESSFTALKNSSTKVAIALTRPIRMMPVSVSMLIALSLYGSKKFLSGKFHSRAPHLFGFRSEHIDLGACVDLQQAHQLLAASAAAVPITPAAYWAGNPALDGGFYDSTPLPKPPFERARTLVLLTRYRPEYPHMFEIDGCTYVQPSRRIDAVNFDCTNADNVRRAYQHGKSDAQALLAAGR